MSLRSYVIILLASCLTAQNAVGQTTLWESDLRIQCAAEAAFLAAVVKKHGPKHDLSESEISAAPIAGLTFAWLIMTQERFGTVPKLKIRDAISSQALDIASQAHETGINSRVQIALEQVDRCKPSFDQRRTQVLIQKFIERRN